jgi:hypothetical protein
MLLLCDKADAVEATVDSEEHREQCVKPAPSAPPSDFRQTGVFYSATEKRLRPLYFNLEDAKVGKETKESAEDATDKEESECRKYYEKHRKFTGGIMIIWCRSECCSNLVRVLTDGVFLQTWYCSWIPSYPNRRREERCVLPNIHPMGKAFVDSRV